MDETVGAEQDRAHAPAGPADGPDGIDELFIKVLPQLRRGVRRLAGGPDEADDVLQDLYLRLRSGEAGRRFLSHPNPVGYGAVIVRNLLRDDWRRRRRNQDLLARIQSPDDLRWDGGLCLRESELEVMRELRCLSDRQAAAVGLIDIDGHTLDAAADLLGVHRGSVHRTRIRALQKLRARIEGAGRDRGREQEHDQEQGQPQEQNQNQDQDQYQEQNQNRDQEQQPVPGPPPCLAEGEPS